MPRSPRPIELRTSFSSEASSRGNHVRAAIRRARQRGVEPGRRLLLPLANQLARLLALPGERAELRQARTERIHELLPELLDESGLRRFSLRLRVLFELQALLFEEERPDPLDFVETVRTFGRRPARRPLPVLREVHRLRGLRRVSARLGRRSLRDEAACAELSRLLGEWVTGAEERFLQTHTSEISGVLQEAGVCGGEGARREAARWLLERVLLRGGADFLDLRDALARGGATLADLSFGELLAGDALLRADRRIAVVLDGVYVRGEGYLRLFQRGQSMLFGTQSGRVLSTWLLFPLLFSFIVLEFAQHVLGWIGAEGWRFVGVGSVVGLAAVFSAFLNLRPLRRWVSASVGRPLSGLLERLHGGPPPWARRLGAKIAASWRRLFGSVTRFYYQADELVRYRGGHRAITRHIEAWVTLAIFVVGYWLRFLFRLTLEPTLNPLKHFPVVTVVGKLSMTGLFPAMVLGLQQVVPMAWAGTLALPICLLIIPGMAGFVAWEMRTNWSLYRGGGGAPST